ncbi:MAG TPA: aminotransferase class I/II-fold pyridoxal phosphate-dependent enzyme [Geothrix sp.]|nr:aminotransferase class I/II-fold pyridoxal phosphate-dependent enzyme [Geothrix sp.]
MPTLNRLATAMQPSPTMTGAAATCVHPDPVDLTVGEPSAAPPPEVCEAAASAAREDRARYGPAAGLPALRALVAQDLTRRDGLPRRPDQVLITPGGKAALLDALRCLLDPGDEVLVFSPYWPSFPDQIAWAGGTPVLVPHGEDQLPSMMAVEEALSPKTRAVILNQPANPSGVLWDEARMRHLAELASRHGFWVIVDQVYGTLALDGPERPFLSCAPELADRTLLVESFSKRFAMTGYRLGAAAGPAPLIQAMTALGSSSVTHASMLSQHAGIAALSLDGAWEREQLAELRAKRDLAFGELVEVPGLQVRLPQGGLYLFPDASAWMRGHGLGTDLQLTQRLRDEAGVKLLPGSAFGAQGHLRISLGAPRKTLERGIHRLRDFFAMGGPHV